MPTWYAPHDVDSGQLNMVVNSRTPYATARERLMALRDWAVEHDLWVSFSGNRTLEGKGIRIFARINPDRAYDPLQLESLSLVPNPYAPDEMIDPFQQEYEGMPLSCAGCGSELVAEWGLREGDGSFIPQGVAGPRWLGCRQCFGTCVYRPLVEETPEQAASHARLLGRPVRPGRRRMVRASYCGALCERGQQLCPEHRDPFTCAGCQGEHDRNLMATKTNDAGETFCEVCWQRRCGTCLGPRGNSRQVLDDHYVCTACYTKANQVRIEVVDAEVRMSADELLIPALPDRPIRLVSIEQEFEGMTGVEGNNVARALFAAGLSCYNERMRYHAGDHTFPAHIERDRTVENGGELIYNRLDLSTPEDAANMAGICDIVKEHLENGGISFTAKCGTHIHIDLHGYTIPDARNLVTIYSYLEDVIFRLGSAGYGDHRSITSSSDYSIPIRKDRWGNIVEFGVEFLRNADHRDSLNMQHFYNSLKACECGAIEFGNIDDCACIRPKCTAEWRVFNGTGNSKKLHAWTAFVQAMTAWCKDRELDLDLYEPLGFEQGIDFTKELGDAHNNLIEAWRPRLEWVWANLPLTDGEKDSLVYCIRTSPLQHVGEDFITHLGTIERQVDPNRELALTVVASRQGFDDPIQESVESEPEEWSEPDEEDYDPEY